MSIAEWTYANFVQEMRARRVLVPGSNGRMFPVSSVAASRNLNLPSYDFELLFEDEDVMARVMKLADEFGSPKQRPGAIIYTMEGEEGLPTRALILHRYEAGQRNLVTRFYQRFGDHPWHTPASVGGAMEDEATAITMAALSLLDHPEIIEEVVQAGAMMAVNATAPKGHAKVPDTKIIRLTRKHYTGGTHTSTGRTHASPIPHDRAPNGYSRTYKRTGITKHYPGPIKVRGGAVAAPPHDYLVRK